jgi:maltooligosyltrehalose trehalohydrolase
VKRQHQMPFGAEFLNSGSVRFRLWAPEAKNIDLLLGGSTLAMPAAGSGWFELITREASAGSKYRFLVDGKTRVPDPASRFQPNDVHGESEVIDPTSFEWQDVDWHGRPWNEAVIYELHVGAFSSAGSFSGVEEKLDYLANLGITVIELMPLSDFAGKRNWGYDGVLPYAPDSSYGRPNDLKRLVQAAHAKGLMVMLDVVYNHFGPEGNYLHAYAPQFFTKRHSTPWGDAIDFDGPCSRVVRDFFIHNALYWLKEFHLDGLRFDAVHAIKDDSPTDILTELAQRVRSTLGKDRHIHLVLENDDNTVRYLEHGLYNAQWNDDLHHIGHILTSGEHDGYYADYPKHPIDALGKCLTEGFFYQGQTSEFREGQQRGGICTQLPLTAFVSFLQNHDQVGNRALGERILSYANSDAVRAVMTILLLAPSPPLLFMGEEFAAKTPFLFFCDFGPELAKAVTEGRRAEFAKFAKFADPAVRESIPDPNAESTFRASKLDWNPLHEPQSSEWLKFYSTLLALRKEAIVPLLREIENGEIERSYSIFENIGLHAIWKTRTRQLDLIANLGDAPISPLQPESKILYSTFDQQTQAKMPPWSAAWYLKS